MARIFPERPPQSILDDPSRSAELKVFLALKTLPEKYIVFYSLHWQAQHEDYGVNEGEADFIIAHPEKGVIVLEVKGGGIRYDAGTGKWFSHSRSGEVFQIHDPVDQARRNHYEIKRKLENLPGWAPRKFNIWHAVCFPDVHLRDRQFLKPDLPRETVLDAEDLNEITAAVGRIFSHCFGANMVDGAPGSDRMMLIQGLLASSFTITTPLGVELQKEDEKLVELTEQQFRALALLGDRRRAAIAGCAGSGKTMLAARKAQQFSELGMSVLLVCFNTALSKDLRQRLPQEIEVYTFHDLCRQAARQAGYALKHVQDETELFDVILPEALLEAAETIGRVYDAVIVDEGQDFQENYWIALESLLKEDGYLYVFFDNNQNLFGSQGNFGGLITEPPFQLYQNCRNTKSIHELVARFHNNPSSLLCLSPAGRPPEVLPYHGDEDLRRQVQKILHRLVVEEHVNSDEIVVLTPRGEKSTCLVPGQRLGPFTITSQLLNHSSKIQATSVYKFKGLERKVVILAEIDNKTSYNHDMVMYVGCSRARTHLIILSDENAPQQVREKFAPYT